MTIIRGFASLSVRPAAFSSAALFLAASLMAVPALAEKKDARAQEIAARTLEAMGGEQAWNETRFLRFDFFGFRTHHWDRQTGRHRLEGKNREGDSYVVLTNLWTREGKAFLNGEPASGETAEKLLESAYGAWINDTYWLLMPYKLRDPGVTLVHDGEEELNGATYDKLKLTFDGVGLTPGDTYWAYINRETGLMDRWAYHLQDWEEERPATHWQWKNWQTYGKIKLSSERLNPENDRQAELGDIAVLDSVPDVVFETP